LRNKSPQKKLLKFDQIATIAYNMKGCLQFSTFLFEYRQIWLKAFMLDIHLGNITKLKKRNTGSFEQVAKI
jgi:hypothetical protein